MFVTDDKSQVPGAESGVADQPVTPAPASEVAAATPAATVVTPPQVDVDGLKAKYEKDINQLKSSLQRQTAQVEKEWQNRYGSLQKEMHSIRMQGMTEDERARYERQLESEEFQSMQSRLTELESERASQAATVNAFGFFVQQGVPADKLNLAEGYDVVVQSGWQYLTEELARLRQAQANPEPQKPADPDPLQRAPSVVTDKGIPATGTTWAALRQQFGSDEAIYRAIEEQRLDPSVLPQS